MIIHLTTDFFWTDTSSIERWPEILARLPERIQSKSRVDVAKNYLGYKTDENGRILRADEVYGLFGFENNGQKVIIVGCNYIMKDEDGYILSEEAFKLVSAYRDNDGWERLLAKQLLKYSVRVRALMIGLLNGEGILFSQGFLKEVSKAYLTIENERYFALNKDMEIKNLNDLMTAYPRRSVGPYWAELLNVNPEEEIEIQGINKKDPSLKQVGSYFKMPLLLFEYLEWFVEKEEGLFSINEDKVKEDVGKEVIDSLLLDFHINEVQILKNLISENGDIRGYFPVAIVGEILKSKIEPNINLSIEQWIDQYFIKGFNERKFRLAGYEQGQPRHGRGLLGDKEKQLIKLEF